MSEEKQLQDASVQDNGTGQDNPNQGTPIQGDAQGMGAGQQNAPGPKKMKTGVRVAIAVAAVLLIGVAGFAAGKIFKAVKKANMNPTEYYQYAVKKSRDEKLENLSGYFDVNQKALSGSQANRDVEMSVKVSDTAKSLMNLSGLNFSGLDNIGLHVIYGAKEDNVSASMALKVNDEDLLTGKASVNTKERKTYIQLPELSSSYLDCSETLAKEIKDVDWSRFSLAKQREALPDGKEMEDFIVRYSDIFIKNAQDVEKKKEATVQVEDISEKATTYSFTMKNDKIIKLLQDFLKELQKDKVMKKLLESVDEESYSSFTEEIKELQGELSDELSEEALGEVKVTVEAQIGSDDRIVSEKISLEKAGEELGNLLISYPQNGNKFGEEIKLQVQGKDLFRIVGSGTDESDVINGEFKLGVDSSLLEGSNVVNTDELLVIKLKDYDYSKISEGKMKGSCTLSTSAVAALANASLVIEQEGDMDNSKMSVKVMTGKDTLVTVDITSKGNAEVPDVIPGENDKVYNINNDDDMTAYQNELDMTGIMNKIKEKTGIDVSSLLGAAMLGDEGLTDPGDAMRGEDMDYGDLAY